MTPSFFIEATGETVLIKPNGTMEFRGANGFSTNDPIPFESESQALAFARDKGWKEIQPV